uniref:Proteasome activator complex subunit 3 n=2 Tax=Parasteatoda tepidariorum TaxID=114398 RepID=A0A2L2XXS9_PARTP
MEALYKTAEKFKLPNAGKDMVNEYKEKVKSQAENLVINVFPQKILELEAILQNEKLTKPQLSSIHCDLNIPVPEPPLLNHDSDEVPSKKRKFGIMNDASDIQGTKVLLLPNGTVPSNTHIVDVVELVKPRIQQLVEDANVLKMWIQFLIPRIEDGNNFGVSIQEDTLGEVRTVESEAAAYFDQISRYFLTRGKIVSKVAKYPHVDDFRRTVQELDEKEFLSMRLIICELRNHYATLHDMITKNLEKIKKPRTSNADAMY